MNSGYGGSKNSFDFDLGIGSNRSKPLKDQKTQPSPSSYYSSSFSANQSKPAASSPWQPNKPSWTHQPAPSQLSNGPPSMVGDISGKSWNSAAPSGGIGVINGKNPNLFGDLLGSALNNKSGNAPLKNVAAPKSGGGGGGGAYSMGNLSNSLPKTTAAPSWGPSVPSGTVNNGVNRNVNVGGPSLKTMGGVGMSKAIGGGMNSNKDPFGSLVDFGTKQSGGGISSGSNKGSKPNNAAVDDAFADFQSAPKTSTPSFPSSAFSASSNDFMGSSSASNSNWDGFGMPAKDAGSQNQPPVVKNSSVDPLDMLFSSSTSSAGAAPSASGGTGAQQSFSVDDDWGMDSEFGGGNSGGGGTTTELNGLPPPPSGVTASSAKNKGMDNYKQGQYADAIKWLSWAVILLDNAGDDDAAVEVLSCRASCYKEVGEYKKAVADCTKVLEHDGKNVSVLVQRALLYESIEKYRLGAEDLRTVLKIDPGNRVARSTVHRLSKMAD